MSNDNFISEINEELRSDRLRTFWRSFGVYVIGIMVGLVLLVAAQEGWTWWTSSNSARSSDEFYTALKLADGGDYAGAEKALQQIETSGFAGYPELAKFRSAGLLAQQGKVAEAVAAYDALAGTEKNVRLREVALALAGMLLVDGGDVAQVEQRVGTLATGASAMRNVAREALGLVNIKAGKLDAAQTQFQAILEDAATGSDQKQRVSLFQAQLVAEGAPIPTKPEAAATPAPAPAEGAATPAAATTDSAAPAAETKPAN
jgi:hypothetical protein